MLRLRRFLKPYLLATLDHPSCCCLCRPTPIWRCPTICPRIIQQRIQQGGVESAVPVAIPPEQMDSCDLCDCG